MGEDHDAQRLQQVLHNIRGPGIEAGQPVRPLFVTYVGQTYNSPKIRDGSPGDTTTAYYYLKKKAEGALLQASGAIFSQARDSSLVIVRCSTDSIVSPTTNV